MKYNRNRIDAIFIKHDEEKPKPKSPWFCDSDIAIKHKKNCKKDPWNCDKCIWIDESSVAMGRHGTEIIREPSPNENHPLQEEFIKKFNGREV